MSDAELRELARQTAHDPSLRAVLVQAFRRKDADDPERAARAALAQAHLGQNTLAAQEALALERWLKQLLGEHAEELKEQRRFRGKLGLDDVAPLLEAALAQPAETLHWATHLLARAHEYVEDMDFYESPLMLLGFAVRAEDEVTLSLRLAETNEPSPGRGWSELKPWRQDLRPATREKRLRAFLSRGARDKLRASRLAVEIVLEKELATQVRRSGKPRANPATVKQLKFAAALRERLDPSAEEWAALTRKARMPEELGAFTKTGAAKVINLLQERLADAAVDADPASDKQRDLLRRLKNRKKLRVAEWATFLEQHGVLDEDALSKPKASVLIDLLLDEKRAAQAVERARKQAAKRPPRAKTSKKKKPQRAGQPQKAPPRKGRGKKKPSLTKETWQERPW